MGLKDRLLEKSGDLGNAVATSTEPPRERGGPKTGPGQMLAYRSELATHVSRVEELEAALVKFAGALPTRQLDPRRVHPSRWANRHAASFQDKEYQELCESLRATGGNKVAVLVRPLPGRDDEFELVFGNRRHHGCLANQLPLLAVIDESITDHDLFLLMEHENRNRKNPSAWEQGRSYKMALDDGLWPSQNAMAESIHVSQSHVSRCVAAYMLPEAVVGAFASPNDIQFHWIKDLTQVAQLDKAILGARIRMVNGLEDRTPKRVYQTLTAGEPDEAITTGTPDAVSNAVTVSVSGKDIKVVCKKTTLTAQAQQALAELVDDFITAQLRAAEEEKD
ncbi:ParB/RepB/Spo0J family partition protein [Cupriavidus pauculus]|uniref:ParB/RepB/Spo0J family partition protein n=1 Tax=Cupriavidus pauculus TaxID=82633 RepID=UPI0038576EF6